MEYLMIALAACLLDQGVKLAVTSNLAWNESITVIPGLLSITRISNTGMALSMLEGKSLLLGFVSVAASLFLAYIILFWKLPKWERLGLSFVLGGALGNMLDRLFFQYVVDMIDVRVFTFNVADAFITCGAALFLLLYLIRTFREEKETKNAANGDKNGNN